MQRQNDDPLSGPIRKKSKPSEDSTDEPDHETKTERQRVRFKGVDDSETETSTCPACKQIIVKETEEYDSLMEKSVTMVTFLHDQSGLEVWSYAQSFFVLRPLRFVAITSFSGISELSEPIYLTVGIVREGLRRALQEPGKMSIVRRKN